jgi:SNF family Na+-dependent transporter
MYLLQLLDWYATSIPVILICALEVAIIAWIYGVDRFVWDIQFMIGKKVEAFWIICWKYVTPIILSVGG